MGGREALTRPILGAASALGVAVLLAGAAFAQVRGDIAPLGRGSSSGAVCQAVRDYDDPVAQHPGGRAWVIRCEGWDTPIGRLYWAPTSAALAPWRKALAARTECKAASAETLAGLVNVTRAACRLGGAKAPYLVYEGRRGRFVIGAEGYAAANDVLETGLRVTSGAIPPPPSVAPQESAASAEVAADFGGSAGGLSSAQSAAATDVHRLLARGYVQNNEWRFDLAATDFRALVAATQAAHAPVRERAEALLNLALNVSDNRRFAEADLLFAQADGLVQIAADPVLTAEALNYRALHFRNQRRFGEAVEMAQRGLQVRAEARQGYSSDAGSELVALQQGQLVISDDLANALNVRGEGQDVIGGDSISPARRLLIQDAEAYEVIGSSKAQIGDLSGAAAALNEAVAMLSAAKAQGVLSVRLRARVLADLGDLDVDAGHPAAAVSHYGQAIEVLRIRHAGTSTEAGLLLDLGRAQLAIGRQDLGLVSYGRAFELFGATRGSLGSSADATEPYFDLLVAGDQKDPAQQKAFAERFFAAAETVVSPATAQTVARLAARVASGDDATAGLVRAVDDTRRQVNAAESRIAALQAANAYTGAAKTAVDADLKALQGQLAAVNAQLLTANPRYDQLVRSSASLSTLQAALRPGEVYVKTVLLADRGYGLIVSPTFAKPYAIALTRDRAAKAAQDLRAPFEAEDTLPPFDVAAAYSLFETLFGPVKSELLGARHLIYEPDAALISVPAALFVTDPASVALIKARPGEADKPDYRGVAWLGARVDSSLVLSAASFLQSRAFKPSRARQAYLGFGDPDLGHDNPRAFASLLRRSAEGLESSKVCASTRSALLDLPPLHDTAGEVRTIAARLGAPQDTVLGAAFNDASVRERKDLSDFRVVYFATHALLPMPDACLPEPALVTSATGSDSDGLLEASDILDLKLDADLVVLSACDTGGAGSADASSTGLQGGGEALGGLTRAMIYAGARGLVVSHWSVDSAATVRLMTELFGSGAPDAAEGLQRAQIGMQQQVKWSHPYYWAPFTVVGDGARPIPTATPTVAAR
jgi:CHAT domain-containing protein/tetratricopeptide (TPR) repeat protein